MLKRPEWWCRHHPFYRHPLPAAHVGFNPVWEWCARCGCVKRIGSRTRWRRPRYHIQRQEADSQPD